MLRSRRGVAVLAVVVALAVALAANTIAVDGVTRAATARSGGSVMETGVVPANVKVEGEGPPIVLSHGVTLSVRTWFDQLEALPRAGFRTIAFDHRAIVLAGRERLRAKLSYTNIGFALAPERFSVSELSAIYSAALGYPVDPTNLRRVLERRGLLEATGERRAPGREGGRPAAVYRFTSRGLEVTDPFAVLRPPIAPKD